MGSELTHIYAQPGAEAKQRDAKASVQEPTQGPAPIQADDPHQTMPFQGGMPILPCGFFANTTEIYEEVASFDIIPPKKIWKYWHVYTITHKKLYDPTANRLENFWWHIWGSKCRNMSGKTIAKLYKNISEEPSFVPLQVPVIRYDGPTIPNFSPVPALRVPGLVDIESGSECSKYEPNTPVLPGASMYPDFAVACSVADGSLKPAVSSSSEQLPRRSILRKTRPILTGPRPSPRFELPAEDTSDDADGSDDTTGALAIGSDACGSALNSGKSSIAKASADTQFTIPSLTDKAGELPPKIPVTSETGDAVVNSDAAPDKQPPKQSGQLALSKQAVLLAPFINEYFKPGPQAWKFLTKPARPFSPIDPISVEARRRSKGVAKRSCLSVKPKKAKSAPTQAPASLPPRPEFEYSYASLRPMSLETILMPPEMNPARGLSLDVLANVRPKAKSASSSATPSLPSKMWVPADARNRVPRKQAPGLAALKGPISAPEPAMEMPIRWAPPVSRPISQEEYRPCPWQLVNRLPRKDRPSTLEKSRVEARGQFADPEGPTTYEYYQTTTVYGQIEEAEVEDDGVVRPSNFCISDDFKAEMRRADCYIAIARQTPRPDSKDKGPFMPPMRPTKTPRIPFGRARSHLNVILDRENERQSKKDKGFFATWFHRRGAWA